ncbi:Protein of unknown function [Frankineae bacterium MT45]|nr:Protein of unknown function [Frankineae bacterium MT45]
MSAGNGTMAAAPTPLSAAVPPSESPERQKALTPAPFAEAVASLNAAEVRSEVQIEPMRAPTRLAPWAHALGADVRSADGEELATGRLVLLYDPDGAEAWDGEFRLVAFASAEMDPAIGADPLLPQVGWSWLTEALQSRGADFLAAGGTVTQTTSTRFGDLHGPRTTVALELRGSWTARTAELRPHLLAFVDLLSAAAGLPPEGVSVLSAR